VGFDLGRDPYVNSYNQRNLLGELFLRYKYSNV
jgi:hypothetical protein